MPYSSTTWEKGQSGNFSGYTKQDAELARRVRLLSRQKSLRAIERLSEIMETSDSASASVAAANAILDRAWGKAVQPTEHKEFMVSLSVTSEKLIEMANKLQEQGEEPMLEGVFRNAEMAGEDRNDSADGQRGDRSAQLEPSNRGPVQGD
jgi:hypothetical protein